MIMPGVQKPHWRPWLRWNASWIGCNCPSVAIPSIVVTSLPSTCTASRLHDLTDSPSTRTVHEPHDVVSHPTLVPVSPRVSRRKYTRSVRGSTSAWRATPLTVTDTLATGPPFGAGGVLDASPAPGFARDR